MVTGLVRLPRGPQPQRFYRLFGEVPRGGEQPTALWVTTLVHLPMEELLELASLSAATPGHCADSKAASGSRTSRAGPIPAGIAM